jgi:hypothetical protein
MGLQHKVRVVIMPNSGSQIGKELTSVKGEVARIVNGKASNETTHFERKHGLSSVYDDSNNANKRGDMDATNGFVTFGITHSKIFGFDQPSFKLLITCKNQEAQRDYKSMKVQMLLDMNLQGSVPSELRFSIDGAKLFSDKQKFNDKSMEVAAGDMGRFTITIDELPDVLNLR